MNVQIAEHDPLLAACSCPACGGSNPDLFTNDDASLDPRAGQTANNKPIWTLDQITANFNRTGGQWGTGPNDQSTKSGNQSIITFGFHENQQSLFDNGYVYTDGTTNPNTGQPNLFGLSEFFQFAAFNSAQREASREAFSYWDDLIAVSFKETDAYDGDINFGNLTNSPNTQAYSRIPTANLANLLGGQVAGISGDIWVSVSQASNFQFDEGQYGLTTLIHEIGHSLGLSHPGAYNAAPGLSITYAANAEYAQDALNYSIMSYFLARDLGSTATGVVTRDFDWSLMAIAYPSTPMVHDIAAAQKLYGADMTTRTGDTTYGFNSNAGRDAFDFTKTAFPTMAIWDAGGEDTLDASGYKVEQRIDLTPGSLSSIGGITFDQAPTFEQVNANRAAAGFAPVSLANYTANINAFAAQPEFRGRLTDNVGIAYGTIIENAKGGSGIDTIIGNTANNKLFGNAGNDVISGAEGNDLLDGGLGNDRLDGGVGSDTAVFTGKRADYLIEAGEGDTFIIRDTRKGSADGTDTLISIEQLQFADGTKLLTQVAVQNVTGVADGKQGYLSGRAGADDLLAIASDMEGTQLRGAAGNDILTGGKYNDFIIGNQGDDVLIGGAGADQFRFFGNEIEGTSDSDRILDLDFAEGDILMLGYYSAGTFAKAGGGFINGSDVIVRSFDQLAKLDAASAKVTVSQASDLSNTLVIEIVQKNGQVQKIFVNDAWQNYMDAAGIPG
jgi:serralysin